MAGSYVIYAVYALTDEEIERLMRMIEGKGGWQCLLRRLQDSLVGTELRVSAHDFEWLCRNWRLLVEDEGGWQQRIPQQLRKDAIEFAMYA